jgi:carbon monoxide dehydrogenase subunit G
MNHLRRFFYRVCLLIVCFIYSSVIYAYDFQVDGLYYNKLSANQVEVTYKSFKDGSYSGILNIPSNVSYNGVLYIVTSIGDYAFYDCHNLSGSLTIPNSVISIGDYAFGNCTGLTGNLIISNSVKSIGDYAFYWCYRLKGSLIIPNSVTSIGEYAFDGCSGLTGSLTISNSVTEISRSAFSRCSGLTGTLTIPNSVTIIHPNAFDGCKSFSGSLTIPKSVVKIGTSSFSKCSGINGSLTIPNSVIEINYAAFYQCNCISRVISEITNPFRIDDYVFMGISSYAILQVPKGTKSMYQIYSGWTKHFKEIIESDSTSSSNYTLSITTLGNGSVLYDGTTTRNGTNSFTVNEGISATIYFAPDNGYRIKDVEVNGSSVSVSDNQYTISSINANTTVSVEFEAIPPATYTLSITASGNGSASYSGTTVRNKTQKFTLNEGISATISFNPDNGHRIKSVKVNNTDVTSSVSNNSYTISNINANTNIEVEFEAIPPATYNLSIIASGNGSATYNGTTVRNNTQKFTLNEGISATILFSPDNGYRIKSVKVNNTDVTSSISNNSYTISSINANINIEVEFEAIPPTTYTLTLKATGNGSASYSGTTVRNNTQKFTLNEGISATISFNPDNGYQIKSATMNGREIADLSTMSFTIDYMDEDVSIEVEFEAIPVNSYTLMYMVDDELYKSFQIEEGAKITPEPEPTKEGYTFSGWSEIPTIMPAHDVTVTGTFTKNEAETKTYVLSITATGNGSVSYNNTATRNSTKTFTLNEGISATITFNPDEGYRIKRATMNGREIADLSSMSFTIDIMDEDVSIEVEFEAIPQTTYTLSITASGIGSATYNNTVVRGKTTSFTVNEGTNATISFTPDLGYRIKSVKVNSTVVTSSVSNGQYTIRNIKANTTVEVIFEAIPTTYTLSITASGNGNASYSGTTVRNDTKSFTLTEGVSATITFSPDNDCRIKSATMNGREIADLSTMSFTIDFMDEDVSIEVEFEAIPFYTLTYVVDGEIYKTYQVQEGAIITPEAEPTKDGYTFSGWSEIPKTMPAYDVTITGTFTKNKPDINSLDKEFTIDGINYEMVSTDNQTVVVVAGEYGNVLEVPANIMYGEYNWDVIGLKDDALDKCEQLAAVIWNPSAMFNIRVKNPNLLLYVQDQTYASFGVKNVIVNGTAESIELTDAVNGNDFYCPRAFTARKISYSHHYNMETGLGYSKGWETIVLPFDVQNYTHATKGEIEPFTTWTMDSNKKPFWLFELTADGYKDVPGIKANTPYIISMPNNRQYELQYQIPGIVTFSSKNVEVKESGEMKSVSYQGRTFVPNYTNQKNLDYLPLNVNNNYVTYEGADAGSKFIGGLRSVHPFEAYMITTDGTRSIDVMDGMTTAIRDICMKEERSKTMKVYDTKGILIKTVSDNEDLRKGLSSGLYIVNGKKMIIK